jgi:hypothetical protein
MGVELGLPHRPKIFENILLPRIFESQGAKEQEARNYYVERSLMIYSG